jgi:hypothetical protein
MASDRSNYGVDVRDGTYDAVSPAGNQQPPQIRDATSSHEATQTGADVRAEPLPGSQPPIIPEGLSRERKGPLSPTRGRGN